MRWLYVSSSQSPSFVTASWVASLLAPSCRLSSAAASYSRSALGSDGSALAEPREDKRTTAKEYCHEDRIHRIGTYGRWHGGEPSEGRSNRKSTRLNSSHANISYAVFCLK